MKDLAQFVKDFRKGSRRAHGLFVSGTNTGIGKTYLTSELVKEFARSGLRTVGFKPICCGDREDAQKYWRLANRKIPLEMINPVHLPIPVAPISQKCPSWKVLLSRIQNSIRILQKDYNQQLVLVEGAGGLLCPITESHTMRELAKVLGFPVLVVARNELGVLNHTLLTVEALRTKNLACAGIILNQGKGRTLAPDSSKTSNLRVLKRLVKLPFYYF
jgi:dethiobiotin synthetase